MFRKLITGVLILTGLCLNSYCRKPVPKQKKPTEIQQDSLARPQDVGEHKSIHQEEWEYYRNDTSQVKTTD